MNKLNWASRFVEYNLVWGKCFCKIVNVDNCKVLYFPVCDSFNIKHYCFLYAEALDNFNFILNLFITIKLDFVETH